MNGQKKGTKGSPRDHTACLKCPAEFLRVDDNFSDSTDIIAFSPETRFDMVIMWQSDKANVSEASSPFKHAERVPRPPHEKWLDDLVCSETSCHA